MTENEKSMYTGMCMCRNNEVSLRWSRSQMFVFINAAAFSFLGLRPTSAGIVVAMGVIGIVLDLFWVYINQKSEEWVNYWQAKIRKIDQEAIEQDVRMFSGAEWDVITRRYTFHEILNAFSGIFMLLWLCTDSLLSSKERIQS